MNAAANMLRSVLNTSRAAMSSGIPKRPPTSYMLFAKAQREVLSTLRSMLAAAFIFF